MTRENFSFQTTPNNFREVGQALARIKRNLIYSNYAATTAPGVTNDVTESYEIGSVWVDVTADQCYVCVDATEGAAVWLLVAPASGSSPASGSYVTMSAEAGLSAERVLTSTTSITVVDGGANTTATLQRAALTGDITASANSNATTLATVNANVGTFGSSTQVGQFTVNAKGLITAAADVAIAVGNSFETINCPAGTDPVADSSTDTLNLASGTTALTITGDSTTDTITFDLVPGTDGLGDVVGPASSALYAIPFYADTTGKLLGYNVAGPRTNVDGELVVDVTDANLAILFGSAGSATIHRANGGAFELASTNNAGPIVFRGVAGGGISAIELQSSTGLEILKADTVASAVNEVTITNAATGGNPSIAASGADTNIKLSLLGKGVSATLSTVVIAKPEISAADWTAANHTHAGTTTGGQIAISDTTGTLAVARGGTGVTTIAALSIWLANSADTITSVTPGAGNSIRINAGGTAWEAYTPGSGGGDVTKVGTPVNNQVGVWTGDGTIEGDAAFTFDTTANTLFLDGTIELGHATDTTLSRSAAGVLAVEGVDVVTLSATQTLTNKTLTSPVLTTPQINDTSADHQYVFAVSELTADRTVTLPLLAQDDTFLFATQSQSVANKTLANSNLYTPADEASDTTCFPLFSTAAASASQLKTNTGLTFNSSTGLLSATLLKSLGNFEIGNDVAATDYTLTFKGETNDGVVTWMEDEDYFLFGDDIFLDTAEAAYFRATTQKIHSSAAGTLNINAPTLLSLNDANPGDVVCGSTGNDVYPQTDNSSDLGVTANRYRNIPLAGKATYYNSVVTAGWGVPAIYAAGRSTAQTAAVASVATYTVGAADGSFIVSANVKVTTATAHSFSVVCDYTDESSTARSLTFNMSVVAGTLSTLIVNTGGTVPYHGVPMHIRCKAATAITIKTSGTFTTVTYNVEGAIQQIA